MVIFKNSKRSYFIQIVPNDVPGVCYRRSLKGWMDIDVFEAWFSEPRAINHLPHGQRRMLYFDNCAGHVIDDESRHMLRNMRTIIQKLPPNATHLVHPADSIIIHKVKDARRARARWENYKYFFYREQRLGGGQWKAA